MEYHTVGKKKPTAKQKHAEPDHKKELERLQRMLLLVIARGFFRTFHSGWEELQDPDRKVFKLKAEGYLPDRPEQDMERNEPPIEEKIRAVAGELCELMNDAKWELHPDITQVLVSEWKVSDLSKEKGFPMRRLGSQVSFRLRLVLARSPTKT